MGVTRLHLKYITNILKHSKCDIHCKRPTGQYLNILHKYALYYVNIYTNTNAEKGEKSSV